jgi:putative aminopeptidase FrvX
MNDRIAKRTGLLLALACLAAGTLWAADLKNLTKELFVIPSTTGNEDLLAGKIRGLLPRGGRGPMARALGVAEGDSVTPKKVLVDFAPGLMAGRAIDDRAGCAALLDAALRLKSDALRGKTVTFAWDVQEETGLIGAAELAKTLKPDYVFAIDTFVSTDSPLESQRFGHLPVGKGAVLRAVDSSNVTPKTELRKVMAIAIKRGIPVQVGNSRGGNDGSVFLAGGAVDIPLSWPGSYAHSLIEKIDRRDLEALSDLILAVISDWK